METGHMCGAETPKKKEGAGEQRCRLRAVGIMHDVGLHLIEVVAPVGADGALAA